jgi:hypothetical protein
MSNCLLLLLVSRLSSDKEDELIELAKAYLGAHTEEKYEDIEEAELDEAWDLTAVEDAPTECLADHEGRNDGIEYTNP